VAVTGTIEIVRILHDRMDPQRHVPLPGDKSRE
jgi:plasmid stabilization system protein ParE